MEKTTNQKINISMLHLRNLCINFRHLLFQHCQKYCNKWSKIENKLFTSPLSEFNFLSFIEFIGERQDGNEIIKGFKTDFAYINEKANQSFTKPIKWLFNSLRHNQSLYCFCIGRSKNEILHHFIGQDQDFS